MKKRALIVCPGRGSYTKETLGYLKKYHQKFPEFLEHIDRCREEINEPRITELDEAQLFKTSLHTKGEHASPLIYACSALDYLNLDQNKYEICGMTGNSMGWYLALALSKVLNEDGAFKVIQTMGGMMKNQLIGGQLIYPIVNNKWRVEPEKVQMISDLINEINLLDQCECYESIRLGGYIVLAGNKPALAELLKRLPKDGDYPFQLINHGAFHTPLLKEVSEKAFQTIPRQLFNSPNIPLIDGRGKIWTPHSCDRDKLYDYTFNHQVLQTYDFTKAIEVGLKEFAPDHIILLGPGNSLGGVLGQIMININWNKQGSKEDFSKQQEAKEPFLISLGI